MKKSFQILLVEDDQDDIDLLKYALKRNQVFCEIEIVTTGEKVIPLLQAAKTLPDIIVLDLNLPKMDGRDILKALKSDEKLKKIPVMVHTTSSFKTDIDFCMEAGAEMYMTKATTTEQFTVIAHTIAELATRQKPAN